MQVQALRAGVAANTNNKRQIRWAAVSRHIMQAEGRNMSTIQCHAKWDALQLIRNPKSLEILNTLQPHVQRRQALALAQAQAQDADEEGTSEQEDDSEKENGSEEEDESEED